MLGLKSHDRVPRFRPEDAVDLSMIETFLGQTVLSSGNRRIGRLIVVTTVAILGAGLIIVTVLIGGLAVVNAGIPVTLIVSVSVVVAVPVSVGIAVSVTVVRVIPPGPPGREPNIKGE